jgi:uncharacterized protein (TIGR02271 family)
MSFDSNTTAVSAPLLLHSEQASVTRRRVEGDKVRVSTVTRTTEKLVEEALVHERIEIEHVAIGRQVENTPSVREEGDVTIIPVVEEILFIEKRLILKEEVRIRRVQVPGAHREVETLREQDVVIERIKPGETGRGSPIELAAIPKQQALEE